MKMSAITTASTLLITMLSLPAALADDPVEDAKKLCQQEAVEKSGYDPAKSPSTGKTVAAGAGIGAAGGATVRAIQGKSLLKGAAIGAAAGAAAGGLKNNRDKKQAVLDEGNYNTSYEDCLKRRGFIPQNVK
jgi:hypothetical protein